MLYDPLTATLITDLLLGLLTGLSLLALVALMRWAFQRAADHKRRTFLVEFPRSMSHEQVLDFVRSAVSEIPRPRLLHPAYAISFEKYADVNGKRYYLHVPGHVSTKVDRLLDKKIEGISIETVRPADDVVARTRWRAVEVGMRGLNRPLRIMKPEQVASSIDANFDTLEAGEALVLQWVIIPDRPRPPTPETKDKVSDHTLHAVARLGAIGDGADSLIRDLAASLRSVNSHESALVKRALPGAGKRVRRRATTTGFPVFLNVGEFTALMGWQLKGSSSAKARPLAPDKTIDTEGIKFGISNHPKYRGRVIAMPHEAADMHVRIMGGSGTGKSNLLLNLGLQALDREDTAFILMEPAGDLAWDMLNRIPKHRADAVIWLDPLDVEHPIGINPLQAHDPERATAHLVGVFKNLSGDSWGHQLQRVLTTAIMTAALNHDTLYDIKQLLVNREFRAKKLKTISRALHPDIFQEWAWIDGKADLVVDSSVNRLDSFLSSRMIRNMVSQREGLDFEAIIRDHKILLVPLPAARMGQMNASAIGQLVREMAWNAAMRQPPLDRQRSVVMLDEFQNFADFSTTKSDPFAEARKYKQQYYIAHQYTEQLPTAVQHTVDKNVATQLVFRLDPEDARKVKDRYKPLTEEDIANLPRFHVAARLMSSSGYAPTVTLVTTPAPPPTGLAHYIIENSRRKYSKSAMEVEAEILTRHARPEPKQRPRIGRLDDDETP